MKKLLSLLLVIGFLIGLSGSALARAPSELRTVDEDNIRYLDYVFTQPKNLQILNSNSDVITDEFFDSQQTAYEDNDYQSIIDELSLNGFVIVETTVIPTTTQASQNSPMPRLTFNYTAEGSATVYYTGTNNRITVYATANYSVNDYTNTIVGASNPVISRRIMSSSLASEPVVTASSNNYKVNQKSVTFTLSFSSALTVPFPPYYVSTANGTVRFTGTV